MNLSGSREILVAGFCEHGAEPSGSIKGEEFLDRLREYKLLKNNFVPWTYIVCE
jgi:hypothetical protein